MCARRLTVGSLKQHTVESLNIKIERGTSTKVKDIKRKKESPNRIDVVQNNRMYKIIPEYKKSLLDTALDQNQMLSFKCKKGTCGKCTVKVLKGSMCLKETTKQEEKKLKGQTKFGYRLACQATINE